ncbi:hypothetical protein [Massilia genomosp. 1]|uniref:Uncharacterized protein n=1 Tax=Massilia genomosp. 1 TaxID=2609280 RepID=A0ABX0MYD9_9BURK|nr:hypothetical protein [Massilia genomosp. 1]NHZ65710.1 hypothetical protein [Massilia genomosp. 1]
MSNFIGQDTWDEVSGTALAEALAPDTQEGRREIARNGKDAILADLDRRGLTLRDLANNDNIGKSLDGRVVVFDVKSLETT